MKLDIGVVLNRYAHPSMKNMVKGLTHKNCKVTIYCCGDPSVRDELISKVKVKKIPSLFIIRYYPISLPSFRLEEHDIINIHEEYMLNSFYTVLKESSTPIVLTEHYCGYYISNYIWRLIRRSLHRTIGRTVVKKAAGFIAQSSDAKEFLMKQGAREEDIEIIYNGVDTNQFKPASRKKEDPPVVLYVGRLSSNKGIRTLIKACQELMKTNLEFRLQMVGSGELQREVERMSMIYNNFEYLGSLPYDQMPPVYQRSSIFVQPSLIDPSPMSLIEAMACGNAIVGSNVGGIKDVVAEKVGRLFPPNDHHALAHALEEILENDDERRKMQREARSKAIKNYSTDVITKKMLRVFRKYIIR